MFRERPQQLWLKSIIEGVAENQSMSVFPFVKNLIKFNGRHSLIGKYDRFLKANLQSLPAKIRPPSLKSLLFWKLGEVTLPDL